MEAHVAELTGQLPSGFGCGRRTSNIVVVQPLRSSYLAIPERLPQPGPESSLDEWTLPVVGAAAITAERDGFNLLWRYLRRGESLEQLVDTVFPTMGDAAVLLAPADEHLPLIALLAEREIPFVLLSRSSTNPGVAWVDCDNARGIGEAVRHLAQLGHRRIGFLAGPSSVGDFEERKRGYLDTMGELGLPVPSSAIAAVELREYVEDMKPVATRFLRGPERPTAIVCNTDPMATAVIRAAWEMGLRVPEDIAVTGFDDTEMARQVRPRITTLRQPLQQIGATAIYLAACAVLGHQPETGAWQVTLPSQLIVRESCGARPRPAATDLGEEEEALTISQEDRVRQLESASEEVRSLLYTASHDLRAPLITINGFASRLDDKYGELLDEHGKDYLARIRRSATSMGELIDALLSLSRAHNQPLNLQTVSLAEVVEAARRDLEGYVAKAKARIEVEGELPVVVCDPVALRQVFTNLIGNALKYGGSQGSLRIEIGCRERPGEHECYVRDNGAGIAPEHHERIFQPFQRGPKVEGVEGTGIGLSAVRGIVLRHSGRIWVESEVGQGATFRFTLPRRGANYEANREHAAG